MHEVPPPLPEKKKPLSGKETYNVVADTVIGANLRAKDNLFQAAVIGICLLIGGVIGLAVASRGRVWGGVVGGFLGVLVGLFGSGIFLMVYRFVRHVRGKHD